MTRAVLSNKDARRIFLDRHRLSEVPQGPASGSELLSLIETLGFVQLDSINTVARAHDLILFSRRPRYRPKALKALYERDRDLFEHWTHDAAVIPLAFYPHWHLRRQRDAERLKARWQQGRREGFEAQFQTILDQIREYGPVSSSDVGKDEARGSGGWWDWHPSKTALEYLWRSGALCVIGRDGFQKRYDLTERVLSAHLCDTSQALDVDQTINWCCDQALARLGFATHGELAAFWAHISPAEARDWCMGEIRAGKLEQVHITGADGTVKPAYARPGINDDTAIDTAPTNRLRVLSPFDPALRDRKRAERLFGFNYRVEMFVPAPQRTYGYYVFPILQGDRLVARVDMKAFRDTDTLRVKALWPEPKVRWSDAKQRSLEAELWRLTNLAGVTQVAFDDGWLRGAA
jgi:hypothetical protein